MALGLGFKKSNPGGLSVVTAKRRIPGTKKFEQIKGKPKYVDDKKDFTSKNAIRESNEAIKRISEILEIYACSNPRLTN